MRTSKSILKKDSFSIRFLTIVNWNLENEKQKLKSSIFASSFIVNQTSSQTEFIIGKSDFPHIMHFQWNKRLTFGKFENITHWKMVSVQFWINFTGPSYCGGLVKKLQNFNRYFFWSRLSKNCIIEFTALACYLVDLDDNQWNEVATSTARNSNNSWLLYLHFSNMINLCPNIWFI